MDLKMIETREVPYEDGNTQLRGFLAWDPNSSYSRPGILVVHGGAGLDDHAKGRSRRLAESGYVVFACDMYGEGVSGNRERVMQCITKFQRDPAALCDRANAGLEVLKSNSLVNGQLAAVGYCFGGMTVLQMARSGSDLAGVVSVHGSLETSVPAQQGKIRAKILVCHGALDPHVPMTHVSTFAQEMIHAGADWQLIMYGGAMHGFTHENAKGQQPGVAYDAASDARSSMAIKNFLAEISSL
jgi:dienelactone hydrolase